MSITRQLLMPLALALLASSATAAPVDPSDPSEPDQPAMQTESKPAPAMAGQQAPRAGASIPTRGMTMKDVERLFGAPRQRHPPVGKPPITRWDYDGMSVYFEYKHVIHSVIDAK